MEKKVIAIVQARLTSSRFPKKILRKIGENTVLNFLLKRLKKSKKINKFVLLIIKNKENFTIKKKFKNLNVFLGSETDVLDRYYKAAKKFKADVIVRICADCPFIDPLIIDKILKVFETKSYDYISNTIKPTFPDGFDVEVFSFSVLQEIWRKAEDKMTESM